MKEKNDSCCDFVEKKNVGFFNGILYGVLPHTFCIAFILFSVIGSVTAVSFLKKFLIIPYFFTFLVIVSFLLATFSAFIYLRKTDCLCLSGIKRKWKYLVILYLTMILINVALFVFVFPAMANINSANVPNVKEYNANLSIVVEIPCSGHASLIVDELKKNSGVGQVIFKMPNIFNIKYDPAKTSSESIFSTEIFKTYRARLK
jgi:hypothetical protein